MSGGAFANYYRTSDQYAGFDQEHRRGGTFGLAMMEVMQGAGEYVDPPMPELAIVTSLGAFDPGEFHYGDGWRHLDGRAGMVDIHPAHTEATFRVPDLHISAINVPEPTLAARLDELGLAPCALSAVTGTARHLPRAAVWTNAIWTAFLRDGPAGTLDVDAAFLSLLAELLRACGDDRPLNPPPAVGDARLRRVIDYVEAHIETSLNVGELAGIACVSVFHFGRIFRAATGETPHRYVMRRRVERAKEMLLATELDLTSIALACGFASHSHLTECFHRHVGAAPGAWRKEMQG